MKSFIHIGGSYYSIDGILAIHNLIRPAKDILPEMLENVVRYIGDIEADTGLKIKTIKIQDVNESHALEIVHASEEDSILYLIPSNIASSGRELVAAQEFLVDRIASSSEPILEIDDIITEFHTRKNMTDSSENI